MNEEQREKLNQLFWEFDTALEAQKSAVRWIDQARARADVRKKRKRFVAFLGTIAKEAKRS